MKNIYFDTETTDLNPGQILQLSYIVEEDGAILKCGNQFFTVESIAEGAQKTHGFSVDDSVSLSGGKLFKDCYEAILSDFSDARLVAHNLPFDEKFLSSEFWRCGVSFRPADRMCTMQYWKDILKIPSVGKAIKYGPYKSPKVSEVLDALNIDIHKVEAYAKQLFGEAGAGYHDARMDTTAIFVAVNIQRNLISGDKDWINVFCK